jgi:transketolase
VKVQKWPACRDDEAIAVLRGLILDAAATAGSGHSGTALALAPLVHVLFTRFLAHDPSEPGLETRDRFVLSAGHAGLVLHSVLHLRGFGVGLDDLRAYRRRGSKVPGHPESWMTEGVEVTTGPLGQGVANAVGIALARRIAAARDGVDPERVFVVCSDGDLMEGVALESASLAGHLGLSNLVAVHDDNRVTVDGPVELARSEDTADVFRAFGWRVVRASSAEEVSALEAALTQACQPDDRPTLVQLPSVIGWPCEEIAGTSDAHDAIVAPDLVAATRTALGLADKPRFHVPADLASTYRSFVSVPPRRTAPAKRAPSQRRAPIPPLWAAGEMVSTRRAAALAALSASDSRSLLRGSADLTNDFKRPDEVAHARRTPEGTFVHFGVREHAMAGIMNGVAADGTFIPVCTTMLAFSDYMRPAVRLAAMSRLRVIFLWSHDSLAVGEDGPTHQPVEQLPSLRAMPGLTTYRPADGNEASRLLHLALDRPGPAAFVLSRQELPVLAETAGAPVERGAYVIAGDDAAILDIIATGSEVASSIDAARLLEARGIPTRVISMPSWELFDEQDAGYRSSIVRTGVPRLAVEAAASLGWERYASAAIGVSAYGRSMPGPDLMQEAGFSPEALAERASDLLSSWRGDGGVRRIVEGRRNSGV